MVMGLSVHYRLSASEGCDAGTALRLMEAARREMLGLQREGRVEQVLEISDQGGDLQRFGTVWLTRAKRGDSDTKYGVEVRPEEGFIFPIMIGEDCEPLWLGLCRYPQTVGAGGKALPTRLGRGWRFSGACKTQYASLHGWPHFLRCHTGVIDLLARCRSRGVRVKINDEGGYWPRRSLTTLQRKLDEMNGLVAATAGALKDAVEEQEKPGSIESPIFQHAKFEKLEAESASRHGEKLRQVVAAVRAGLRDAPQRHSG